MARRWRESLSSKLSTIGGLLPRGGRAKALAPGEGWDPYEVVPLGSSGVRVSRTGFGTGTRGWKRESNQTRLGREALVGLLRDAYERGVRFFDAADVYGSHALVAEALAPYPRESYALQTKVWVRDDEDALPEGAREEVGSAVPRFLAELGTGYIDAVLLHLLVAPDWPARLRREMDALAALKAKGAIRAHGVSVHSLAALEAAVAEPWVDAVLVRLNAFGVNMDDRDPEKVAALVRRARAAGKGTVAMKLVGGGRFARSPARRDASVRFVLGLRAVDAMVVGFERIEEVDDFAARVRRVRMLP